MFVEDEDPQASAGQNQEPPEGTTPPAGDDQDQDEEEYQGTYETLEDGRLRWDDGVVTDAEGNVVEETPAAPVVASEPVVTVPAAPAAPSVQPAAPAAQPQRQIYTRDALEAHIFSDAALQEIADMRLTNPLEAERRMVGLQRQFNDQMDNIRRYAGNIFDQEVEAMRTEAPETLSLVGEQVQRAKQQLTPEQMQQPGIGRQVVAMVAAQMFTQQTSRMEDMARSFKGGTTSAQTATTGHTPAATPATAAGAPPAPSAPQPPARRVIPRTERLAGPGSGATPRPQRRRPGGGGSADSRIRFLMNLHGIGEEEARDMAESLAGVQKELQRSHLGGR